jgi:S1-C subfamily serine protease
MKCGGILGMVLLLVAGLSAGAQEDRDVRRSVVKVFCTSNALNLSSPWKRGDGRQKSGTGLWLGGNRILTNEHVISYATQISDQPYESAERIPAEVVVASPEMDLAFIELDSDELFAGLNPPTFAEELPKVQSTVRVYGFPEGGTSLSVTEGIVSRVEYRPYSHGTSGLRAQVDAAINPGNSGGPAYVEDQIIGIAFQKRARSDNIGYLIPSEEVLRFLEDVEDGQYDGKLLLPIGYQNLLNRSLRAKLGLEREVTGVWVRKLIECEEDYPIRVGDVVTHIGDHDIDNSGQTKLGDDLRVNFEYFVVQVAQDGVLPMRVMRDGEELEVEAPVRLRVPRLLRSLKGEYPSYFVYGPLVFVSATSDVLAGLEAYLGSSDSQKRLSAYAGMTMMSRRSSPLLMRRYDFPEFEDEELVMVTNWLPHRIGIGFSAPNSQVVGEVNGIKIRNLEHLVATLRDLEDEYVVFQFADEWVETLVFERQQLEDATEDILLNNAIPRQGSKEALEVWGSSRQQAADSRQ